MDIDIDIDEMRWMSSQFQHEIESGPLPRHFFVMASEM
jgi:hypothetical protein